MKSLRIDLQLLKIIANEKERYSPPEPEILHFASEDIIAASLPDERTDKPADKCFGDKSVGTIDQKNKQRRNPLWQSSLFF